MWKKITVCLLLLLTVSGCSEDRQPTQKALDFRTALMNAGGCSFEARISADYGGRVYDFTLDCVYTNDGEAALTVTEPEAIAGISATVSPDGAQVQFDGMALDFGELANGSIAPMATPWLLGSCWLGGYISAAGADGEWERVTILHGYHEEEVTLDTWLDENNLPGRCEISWNGQRYLTVEISNFQLRR